MNMTSISRQQAGIETTKPTEVLDFDALMKANMTRVFNERNAQRRLAALGELYAKDAIFYDPEAVATGPEAISGAVETLLRNLPPDFVFTAAGPAVGHNGAARLFWRVGRPNGPVVITGTDVAHIENGRIKRLYVFVDSVAR
jgi:SnoaL-like domain